MFASSEVAIRASASISIQLLHLFLSSAHFSIFRLWRSGEDPREARWMEIVGKRTRWNRIYNPGIKSEQLSRHAFSVFDARIILSVPFAVLCISSLIFCQGVFAVAKMRIFGGGWRRFSFFPFLLLRQIYSLLQNAVSRCDDLHTVKPGPSVPTKLGHCVICIS